MTMKDIKYNFKNFLLDESWNISYTIFVKFIASIAPQKVGVSLNQLLKVLCLENGGWG